MHHSHSSRLGLAWVSVRDSLWFIPTLAVLIGSVLAMLAVAIPTPETENGLARTWLFGGGAEGARGVLSAIATSLITVTGVVFSVTIVSLQLASSQFTPRVLGSFMADRVNQVVLGVFIGTFTYTLLVLRTIRSDADNRDALVPHVSVTIAVLLLLVSIAALIVFINHSARSIQASVILERETNRTLARVEELFPARVGAPETEAAPEEVESPDGDAAIIHANRAGYLQAIQAGELWELGKYHEGPPITVRMERRIGSFVFPGQVLATAWPADAVDEAFARHVRSVFVIGPERTLEQDAELGIVELSDIALRALSPGINDPTTAMHCIDRLTQILAAMCSRQLPVSVRRSPDGKVRLLAPDRILERALDLAFEQLRHFGAANPAVARKLIDAMADLAPLAPAELLPTLRLHISAVARHAGVCLRDPAELAGVEQHAADAMLVVQRQPGAPSIPLAYAGAT